MNTITYNVGHKTKHVGEQSQIFIVDDHPMFRQGLKNLISQEEDMVCRGEAGNAEDAKRDIRQGKTDLVIVDISLQGASGLELIKDLLADHPELLILVISMYDESIYVERILRAGAKGYLRKSEAAECIIKAVRQVLAGGTHVSDKWRNRIMQSYLGRDAVEKPFITSKLSDRELEVLQFTGQGIPTRQTAKEMHVSVKTIESHYANIKRKLALNNAHELIKYAVQCRLSENMESWS